MPGNCGVDHFQPKSVRPDLAYEWTNYRLANDKINSYKGDSTAVLDPFYVQIGWFVLDFATLWVGSDPSLRVDVKTSVEKTIELLRLNDDAWVEMRFVIFTSYRNREITMGFLQRYSPFIASEVQRQNILPR